MNYFINAENVKRAIEICLHYPENIRMAVVFPDEIDNNFRNKLIQEIKWLGVPVCDAEDAHICVEYVRPDFDSITREMANPERFKPEVKPFEELSVIGWGNFSKACIDLLKTAYNRLCLDPLDVEKIILVSRVIAQMGGSSEIKTEHIAEAIHYSHKTFNK